MIHGVNKYMCMCIYVGKPPYSIPSIDRLRNWKSMALGISIVRHKGIRIMVQG